MDKNENDVDLWLFLRCIMNSGRYFNYFLVDSRRSSFESYFIGD